jgi:tetratricopeptide (TPR) repeat protein
LRDARVVLVVLLTLVAGCGEKLVPLPTQAAPAHPDMLYPAVPPQMGGMRDAVTRHERGWRFLQADDLRNARSEFSAALRTSPAFYPSEAGLGEVALVQRDYKGALSHFDRVLQRAPAYVPALVGRGDALLGLDRPADATRDFESALAADQSLSVVKQRLAVLRLRTMQQEIASAGRAASAGHYDEAKQAYQRAIAASPESAFLYRDLGVLEREHGETALALASFRKAAELDPNDVRSLTEIGSILEAEQDYAGALDAYTRAAASQPGSDLGQSIRRVRDKMALATLPVEYAQIPAAPDVTRAGLAALIGVHFPGWLEQAGTRHSGLITDARSSWAAPWILPVVRAGVMEPFPNHTFQPEAPVTRLELARIMSRLLDLAGESNSSLLSKWQGTQPGIADVPPTNLAYQALAQVVSAGVMKLSASGSFRPADTASGAEAVQAIDRVAEIIGPGPGAGMRNWNRASSTAYTGASPLSQGRM